MYVADAATMACSALTGMCSHLKEPPPQRIHGRFDSTVDQRPLSDLTERQPKENICWRASRAKLVGLEGSRGKSA